jgi:putative effector of murein hydrolase
LGLPGPGPVLGMAAMLGAYAVADGLSLRSGRHPLVNPVVISVLLVGGLLIASGTGYGTYFEGAQFIHFLLGPATVALALPLWEHRALVMKSAVPMLAVLVILMGVMGALVVTPLMNALGIRDYRARGGAVGLVSHGIGTARAVQVDPVAGTFAGIAIGLNAVMTAVVVPLLLGWWM